MRRPSSSRHSDAWSTYDWHHHRPSARQLADEALAERIQAIYDASRGTYGWPRVHAALRREGEDAVLIGELVPRGSGPALATRGFGETQPIESNETEEGRSANRRV